MAKYGRSDYIGSELWERREEDYVLTYQEYPELGMFLPPEALWDKGGDLVPASEPERSSAVVPLQYVEGRRRRERERERYHAERRA